MSNNQLNFFVTKIRNPFYFANSSIFFNITTEDSSKIVYEIRIDTYVICVRYKGKIVSYKSKSNYHICFEK